MKHLIFSIALAFCFFTSADMLGQAQNTTTETWTISYYGATTIVGPMSSNVTINIGTNCAAGISVTSQYGCSQSFPNATNTWFPGQCTDRTWLVIFGAQVSQLGCPLDRPEFSFIPW